MANNYRMSNFSEPTLYNSGAYNNSVTVGSVPPSVPPALPPRPFQNQRYGGWNNGGGYAGGYGGGYGYSGYSGYGSGYGGFGSSYGGGYGGMYGGYNRMGYGGMGYGPGNLESRFIQYAEDSSRPAFQSIESVVGAFGGIASMLDSTFMAMTTSFRAILGVAENFGRLRSLFAQFWSTFAIFRTINWIYRKLLSILGLSKHDPKKIQAWADALNESQKSNDNKNTSTWPILVFLGIITSAPYIIYKLFGNLNNSILEKATDPATWNNSLLAAAMFDLTSSNPNELSFRSMQSVKIAPLEIQNQMNLMNSGWLLASVDNKTSGLVPANYVRIIKGNINGTNEVNSSKQGLQNMNSVFKDTTDSIDGEITSKIEINSNANIE